MKKNSLLFILLITCIIFSISSVVASDANDTAITSEEEANIIANTDEIPINSSNENVLEASDDGTFTALQNKINNASKGDTITLDRDYTYDDGFSTKGIQIDKDLTINGNGHTLNGLSKSRIFTVIFGAFSNNKVVLNNIKFTNGKTDLYGGAIFNYADLTVNNCQFTNNNAKYCGGAINSVGNLKANNCIFNKNTAGGDAGAVFTLTIDHAVQYYTSYYKNKTPDGDMEFIFTLAITPTLSFGTDYIKNCVFNNNVAKGRGGGAIYGFSHLNINSCTFKSNKANEDGGAVFANKNLVIKNSKFSYNTVKKFGGAVYFRCHELSGHYEGGNWVSDIKYYTSLIESSTFVKNAAKKGGAIFGFKYNDSDKKHGAKAVKCTFKENKAQKGRDMYGGTTSKCTFIYHKLTLKKVTIKKSAKKLVLKATLKMAKKPIKGKKIIFKFKGKYYKARTNKNGVAKVIIKQSVLQNLKVGKKVFYKATFKASYGKVIAKRTSKVRE